MQVSELRFCQPVDGLVEAARIDRIMPSLLHLQNLRVDLVTVYRWPVQLKVFECTPESILGNLPIPSCAINSFKEGLHCSCLDEASFLEVRDPLFGYVGQVGRPAQVRSMLCRSGAVLWELRKAE